MRRLTSIAATAFILSCNALSAAELRGDSILLCDKVLTPRESLKPSVVIGSLKQEIALQEFPVIYQRLSQRLEQTLTADERLKPEVPKFIAILSAASQIKDVSLFQISPEQRTGTEKLLKTHANEITIDCKGPVPQYLIDISTTSLIAARIVARQMEPELAARAVAVAQRAQAAEDLLKNGLPMWPWEMWLNGTRLSKDDSKPLFRSQWVFLRPSAGMEVNTRSRADGNLQASLAVEPVGFVYYRKSDYSEWWGASLVVTSSTRDGIGVGGLVRWNNFVLGATRHKSDTPGESDSTFILLGVDLYDLLNKKRPDSEKFKEIRDTLPASLLSGK